MRLSVAEPLRHKGRLELHVKAKFLASYTSKILCNEKIFDPKIDEDLIRHIRNTAREIYIKSWQANKINAGTNYLRRASRYCLQEEALSLCDDLHASIGIAKQVFHLRGKRMKYWSSLISEVRVLLQGWIESDVKRYGQP